MCNYSNRNGFKPTELDQVNRRVMQLEIEESALKMNLTTQVNIV